MKGDIYIDGHSCIVNKLYPTTYPVIPAPVRQYKEYEIPGRDGKFYEDLGTYEDISWPVEFNFKDNGQGMESLFRKFKRLLRNAKTVYKGTDSEYFYKIKKVDISELNLGTSTSIGVFTATFTLDPYQYSFVGQEWFDASSIQYNAEDLCHPLYKITGEGVCAINVNGSGMTLNCTGTVYIDTDLHLAYREDGDWINHQSTGYFEDLYLPEGSLKITHTNTFEVQIMPRWRCE